MGKRKPVGPICCVHKAEIKDGEPSLIFTLQLEDKSICSATICATCAGAVFILVMRKIEDAGVSPEVFGLSQKDDSVVEAVPLVVNPSTGKPFKQN